MASVLLHGHQLAYRQIPIRGLTKDSILLQASAHIAVVTWTAQLFQFIYSTLIVPGSTKYKVGVENDVQNVVFWVIALELEFR